MFCTNCNLKPNCKEVCQKLSQYLRKKGIYHQDYIRPKLPRQLRSHNNKYREIPFSSLSQDEMPPNI